MDGFKAYKYYAAIKLHFTSPKYNVFKTKGRVKCSIETFMSRNDRKLFEKLGSRFASDKEYIQYIASNFMYHNPNVVYSNDEADANYQEYIRRRQSITNVFATDLNTMINNDVEYKFSRHQIPDVLRLWMSDKITLETVVILNSFDKFTDRLYNDSHVGMLFGGSLLLIDKAKGFVKFDQARVIGHYNEFKKELKGTENGQDVPSPVLI